MNPIRTGTDYIVVHCSATGPRQNIGAKEIDRWHRLRGFLRIGYHFVIRRNGEVETGRGVQEIGAHAANFNARSVGICLVGGVGADKKTPEDNFTPAQKARLRELVANLRALYPAAEVLGHRDLPGVRKACPSFDVRAFFDAHPTDKEPSP